MKSKLFCLTILLIFICSNFSFTQSGIKNAVKKSFEKSIVETSLGKKIDAQPYLKNLNEKIGLDPSRKQVQNSLSKAAAWNFTVGSKKSWYSVDFTGSNDFYQVPSTCRAVGTYCYVFVEDALWNSNKVTQTEVNSVRTAFDSQTPANSSKGIYEIDTETFGSPPNIDGDQKIIILILDIKDGYTPGSGGGFVAGYFHSYNEYTPSQGATYSNQAEIYFMEGAQYNFNNAGDLQDALSTCAHEFQHMIHFNYIPDDVTFFNEAWSLGAEIINGYSAFALELYADESNIDCFSWREVSDPDLLNDYSRASRFALYLKEQIGTGLFKSYLEYGKAQNLKGQAALNGTLNAIGSSRDLNQVLEDWFIANYLNDKSVDSRWGYSYPDLPQMNSAKYYDLNVSGSGKVYTRGVQYYSFLSGNNIGANFSSSASAGALLKVKAIKIGPNKKEVSSIPFETQYSEPAFGTDYNEITFLVYSNSRTWPDAGPHSYTYNFKGNSGGVTTELSYDDEYSDNYTLSLSSGAKQAVIFESVNGTKLDSVTAFVGDGPNALTGQVWEYSGSSSSPLGAKLASDFSVYNNGSSGKWITTSFAGQNISADNGLVVVYSLNQSVSAGGSSIIVTRKPGESFSNSIFYDPNQGGWLWYTDGDGNTWLNRIRAYVSNITDVKEDVEQIPVSFSLGQNYPNPFNPETIINYALPHAGNVQIKVYDALGREIRTLVDEQKPAGSYNVTWNARDDFGQKVSSGVYLYTINAGNFVQTKKMILMK